MLSRLALTMGDPGALTAYVRPWSSAIRETIAELLSAVIGRRLTRDQVYFTNGSTESISLTVRNARALGFEALVLPLPGYFAFELSAARWGLPVAGYVGANDPVMESNVLIVPNGVDGSIPSPSAPALMVDVPFLLHGTNPLAAVEVFDLLRSTFVRDSFIAFSASKDLSIPALRVGLLITPEGIASHSVNEAQLEHQYSFGPVHEVVGLIYACLIYARWLQLVRLFDVQVACSAAEDAVNHLGPHAPKKAELLAHFSHLDDASELCRENWSLVTSASIPFSQSPVRPDLGYSALIHVHGPEGIDIVQWSNDAGRGGLKLSPSVMFGADDVAWRSKFGSEWAFRVNLTQPSDHLVSGLMKLGHRLSGKGSSGAGEADD